MSLTKVRDISVVVGVVGILATIIVVTFTYIASIKTNTESIPSISTAITRVEERTDDIDEIKGIVAGLKAEIKAYITPQKGGELTPKDWRITVTVHPGSIPDPAFLSYTPVATKELPAKLPEGIEPVGYNFALIPHTLTGLQLPKSLQPPAAEAFIPYANLGLDPTIKPTDIFLQSWSEKQGKWIPLETDIREDSLHAHIPAFGLFTLGVPTPEVSEEP